MLFLKLTDSRRNRGIARIPLLLQPILAPRSRSAPLSPLPLTAQTSLATLPLARSRSLPSDCALPAGSLVHLRPQPPPATSRSALAHRPEITRSHPAEIPHLLPLLAATAPGLTAQHSPPQPPAFSPSVRVSRASPPTAAAWSDNHPFQRPDTARGRPSWRGPSWR